MFLFLFKTNQSFGQSGFAYPNAFDTGTINNWVGDTSMFKIENSHLRSHASSETNVAQLYMPIVVGDRMEWEIKLKMAFAPSEQNHTRIYLATNRQGHAYYLKLGENGNADAITFYLLQDGQTTLLFRGIDGRIAEQHDSIRIKITKNEFGDWMFYSAINQEHYQYEGHCSHSLSLKGASYVGLSCHYTATRATLFWFDFFNVNSVLLPDTIPPSIKEIIKTDEGLRVVFDEKINTQAFDLYGKVMFNQQVVDYTWLDNQSLMFLPKYIHGENLIAFTAIIDISGNQTSFSYTFWHQSVQQFDVVINEIMAKPSPAVFLPEVQYVELYNRSNKPIQLKNWNYTDGREVIYFEEEYTLLPDSYVIIIKNEYQTLFDPSIQSLGFDKTIHLTISGKKLSLYDENNQLIHDVEYIDAWHISSDKRAGGWSLEMIDPNNPCHGANNWTSSITKKGGTPGTKNSVYAQNTDINAPHVLNAGFTSNDTLFVRFSERVIPLQFDYKKGKTINGFTFQLHENWMTITLPEKIKDNERVEIHLHQLTDCAANSLDTLLYFQLPQTIDYNDIVINEILYDPSVGGVRFVEIYNRTENTYDLQDLKFVEYTSGEIKSVNAISTEPYLIQANDYVILCADIELLKTFYNVPKNARYASMALPALDRSRGDIVLFTTQMKTIDSMHYENAMHWSLLSDRKGVSLERVDANIYTNHKDNWFSASSTVGFATPGYANSTKRNDKPKLDQMISLSSPYFSPNHDGHMDLLYIDYNVPQYGYMAEINVFTANGFLLKNLLYGTVANQGKVAWDGLDNQGQLVPPGNYIIHCSFFHNEGFSKKEKLTVAVVYQP